MITPVPSPLPLAAGFTAGGGAPAPAPAASRQGIIDAVNAAADGFFVSGLEPTTLQSAVGVQAAVGDPVLRVLDLSSKSRHAISPGGSQRPIRQGTALGGISTYLAIDATDDVIGSNGTTDDAFIWGFPWLLTISFFAVAGVEQRIFGSVIQTGGNWVEARKLTTDVLRVRNLAGNDINIPAAEVALGGWNVLQMLYASNTLGGSTASKTRINGNAWRSATADFTPNQLTGWRFGGIQGVPRRLEMIEAVMIQQATISTALEDAARTYVGVGAGLAL